MDDTTNTLISKLRKRVIELSQGDYSNGYQDEFAPLKPFIESNPSTSIIKQLNAILSDLKIIISNPRLKVTKFPPEQDYNQKMRNLESPDADIDVNLLASYDPDTSFTGSLKFEIKSYINSIERFLEKVNSPTTEERFLKEGLIEALPPVISYTKYDDEGNENLKDFHAALLKKEFIAPISFSRFEAIFSGKSQVLKEKIDWIIDHKSLLWYFLDSLYKHPYIESVKTEDGISWEEVGNCFTFMDNPITPDFKSNNYTPKKYIDTVKSLIDHLPEFLPPSE